MAIENNVLDAMKTVAQSEVSKVKYDRTIVAEVIGAVENTSNRYWVSNGAVRFQATAADAKSKYSAGQKVYVTIPNDDYSSENKVITGAYSDEDGYQISQSTDPFEDMVVAKYIDLNDIINNDDSISNGYSQYYSNEAISFYNELNKYCFNSDIDSFLINNKLIFLKNNKIEFNNESDDWFFKIEINYNNNIKFISQLGPFDFDNFFKENEITEAKVNIAAYYTAEAYGSIWYSFNYNNKKYDNLKSYRTINSKKIPIHFLYIPKHSYDYIGIKSALNSNEKDIDITKIKWKIKIDFYGVNDITEKNPIFIDGDGTLITSIEYSSKQIFGNSFDLSEQIENKILFNNKNIPLDKIRYYRLSFILEGDLQTEEITSEGKFLLEIKKIILYFGYSKAKFPNWELCEYNLGKNEYSQKEPTLTFLTYEIIDGENFNCFAYPTQRLEKIIYNKKVYQNLTKYLETVKNASSSIKLDENLSFYPYCYDYFWQVTDKKIYDTYLIANEGFLPPYGFSSLEQKYGWTAYWGSTRTNYKEEIDFKKLGEGYTKEYISGLFYNENEPLSYLNKIDGSEYISDLTDDFSWKKDYPFSLEKDFSNKEDLFLNGTLLFSNLNSTNTMAKNYKILIELLPRQNKKFYPEAQENTYWWIIDRIRQLFQDAELILNSDTKGAFKKDINKWINDIDLIQLSNIKTIINNDYEEEEDKETAEKIEQIENEIEKIKKVSTNCIIEGDIGPYSVYNLETGTITDSQISRYKKVFVCLSDLGIDDTKDITSITWTVINQKMIDSGSSYYSNQNNKLYAYFEYFIERVLETEREEKIKCKIITKDNYTITGEQGISFRVDPRGYLNLQYIQPIYSSNIKITTKDNKGTNYYAINLANTTTIEVNEVSVTSPLNSYITGFTITGKETHSKYSYKQGLPYYIYITKTKSLMDENDSTNYFNKIKSVTFYTPNDINDFIIDTSNQGVIDDNYFCGTIALKPEKYYFQKFLMSKINTHYYIKIEYVGGQIEYLPLPMCYYNKNNSSFNESCYLDQNVPTNFLYSRYDRLGYYTDPAEIETNPVTDYQWEIKIDNDNNIEKKITSSSIELQRKYVIDSNLSYKKMEELPDNFYEDLSKKTFSLNDPGFISPSGLLDQAGGVKDANFNRSGYFEIISQQQILKMLSPYFKSTFLNRRSIFGEEKGSIDFQGTTDYKNLIKKDFFTLDLPETDFEVYQYLKNYCNYYKILSQTLYPFEMKGSGNIQSKSINNLAINLNIYKKWQLEDNIELPMIVLTLDDDITITQPLTFYKEYNLVYKDIRYRNETFSDKILKLYNYLQNLQQTYYYSGGVKKI